MSPTVSSATYPSLLIRALDRLGPSILPSPPLTAADWRARAERAAGPTVWDDAVVEAMTALEADVREFPPSFVGRIVMDSALMQATTTRIRLRRLHQEGATLGELSQPIIVVGLHRSGTTLLQHLLSALPGRRFIPMYALMSPARPQRWRAELAVRLSRMVGPEMWRLHPVWPMGPDECWMLFMNTWHCWDWTMHWDIPRYLAWLAARDLRPAYYEYRQQLRLLQLGHSRRVVMKGPAHLASLDALLDVIPDAIVVWTHRDPAACVASFGSLSAVQHRTIYGGFDPPAIGRNLLETMGRFVDRALAVDDPRVLHVSYAELMSDPRAVVRRVAERAGESLDDRDWEQVAAVATANPQHAHGVHRYSADQWGLSDPAIRARFAAYLARHPDAMATPTAA